MHTKAVNFIISHMYIPLFLFFLYIMMTMVTLPPPTTMITTMIITITMITIMRIPANIKGEIKVKILYAQYLRTQL